MRRYYWDFKYINLLSYADRDRSGEAEPLSFSLRMSHTQATKHGEQSADETGLRPRHLPRRAEQTCQRE